MFFDKYLAYKVFVYRKILHKKSYSSARRKRVIITRRIRPLFYRRSQIHSKPKLDGCLKRDLPKSFFKGCFTRRTKKYWGEF